MSSPDPAAKPDRDLSPHLQQLVDLLPLNIWVHRTVLEAKYGKQEVKRRLRKIRSEYGWDIRTQRGKRGANDDQYMRCSDGPVRKQNIRVEVRPAVREKLYERDEWTCQMCRCDVSVDQQLVIPQPDHKVPSQRGGATKLGNLQTLCTTCNLKKKQACRHCTLPTCDNCAYAYPEKFSELEVVRLSAASAEKLRDLSVEEGMPPAAIIDRLIRAATSSGPTSPGQS